MGGRGSRALNVLDPPFYYFALSAARVQLRLHCTALEESLFLLLIGASLMSAACQQLWMGCTSALTIPHPQSPIVMFSFLTSTLAWFLTNKHQQMNGWERGAIAKSYKPVINTLFLFSSSEKKTAFACLHSQVVFAVLKAFRTFHQHKLRDLQPHLCFLRDKGQICHVSGKTVESGHLGIC